MADEHQGDWHVLNHLRARNFSLHATIVTTSASNLALDSGSPSNIIFEGTVSGQSATLPDATKCLYIAHQICFFNDSDVDVEIYDFNANLLDTLIPGSHCCFYLKNNSTPAGEWTSGRIQLSKVLVDLNNIVGVSGVDAQTFLEDYLRQTGLPVKNEVPVGAKDCINLVYTLANEAIAGTMEPSLDGRILTPGLDYEEALDGLSFTLILSPNDSNRLNSPPNEREDILVSYCKRVIY